MIYKGFVGPSYRTSNLPIACQRTINWYPENQIDEDAVTTKALLPTPGYGETLDLYSIPGLPAGSYIRQYYRTTKSLGQNGGINGSKIAVVGNQVVWHKDDNSYQVLGQISVGDAQVSITDDGFGMIIADGISMYRLNMKTLAFSNVNAGLLDPIQVTTYNGYCIAIGKQDGVPVNSFFYSGGPNGTPYRNDLWDANSYATCTSSASPILGITVNANYLWFAQSANYELWQSTNDKDLPFRRAYTSGGTIGLTAPRSLVSIANYVYLVGSPNEGASAIYRSSGTEMVKISDVAIDQLLSSNVTSDCVVDSYTDLGHTFIIFNFDALDRTFVYDATVGQGGMWHERASREPLKDTLHRWAPNWMIQQNGITYCGDRYQPRIFTLGDQYKLEDGNPIMRIRTAAHTRASLKPFQVLSVTVDMTTGNGVSADEPTLVGQAPTCMYVYSWDGGRTFSSERRQTFGALGQYTTVLQFRNMGAGKDFVSEIRISDPVRTSIQGAFIDLEVANSYRT